MAETTKIEWCDSTYNPWHGCTKVSPACDSCYAESFSKRIGFSETGSKFPIWGKDAQRRFFGDKHWAEPLKWERDAQKQGIRKRVFCGSMCDVMEDYNGDGHLVRETMEESRRWLYRLIERTPNLDWLLLTKRPQNFRRFLPQAWIESPRPNVWLMTTVESQAQDWRLRELLKTPAAIRGISYEPAVGPLHLGHAVGMMSARDIVGEGGFLGLHWAIAGGESGSHARPMPVEWVRSMRDQCQISKVAFLFKQWGEWCDTDQMPEDVYQRVDANGYAPGLVRIGKKAAGRLLDGRTWDELPVLK